MQVCPQIALTSSKKLQCYNKCRFANHTKTKKVRKGLYSVSEIANTYARWYGTFRREMR